MTSVTEESNVTQSNEQITGGSLAVRLPFSFAKRYGLLVDAGEDK